MRDTSSLAGRHVVFLSWRDTGNPEGGGAERFLEQMAAGLVARGCRVTVFSAAYPGAPLTERVAGVRFVRRGSKLTVYAQGMYALLRRRFGRVDLVVDVQNGMPFLSRLVTRRPVIVLVHHVHREQWPVVYPGIVGRVGWWIESRLAPWLYRGSQYVAVSGATRDELGTLGVSRQRVAVVRNGMDPPLATTAGKAPTPTLCVVGRLVPHKQVEHAIDATLDLRAELPDVRLHVVGSGWWEATLHEYAARAGAGDTVVFEGQVDELTKHETYARSWALALPSLKEGWGLVVGEAGAHGTPAVAYRSAGGPASRSWTGAADCWRRTTTSSGRICAGSSLTGRFATGLPRVPASTVAPSPGNAPRRPSRLWSRPCCEASASTVRTPVRSPVSRRWFRWSPGRSRSRRPAGSRWRATRPRHRSVS